MIFFRNVFKKIIWWRPTLQKSTCHKNKVASNFSNTASFLKLGLNPCVNIFEIAFRKYWHKDLSLTSKMNPCLKNLTPPYFCDMCYFHKLGIHSVIIESTFIKKIIFVKSSIISWIFLFDSSWICDIDVR